MASSGVGSLFCAIGGKWCGLRFSAASALHPSRLPSASHPSSEALESVLLPGAPPLPAIVRCRSLCLALPQAGGRRASAFFSVGVPACALGAPARLSLMIPLANCSLKIAPRASGVPFAAGVVLWFPRSSLPSHPILCFFGLPFPMWFSCGCGQSAKASSPGVCQGITANLLN